MNTTITRWIVLLVAGCALTSSGWLGWTTGRAPLLTELAEQDTAHTKEKLRTFERAAEVLQDAQDRGDALTTTLAQRQNQIDQLTREKHNAIAKVTTGRTCLSEPALRLLNSAPGLSVSGLTPATGIAAAAGATVAPNTDINNVVSTDADITGWAIDAGSQYEICRARLDALIDWHLKTPPATPATAESTHEH